MILQDVLLAYDSVYFGAGKRHTVMADRLLLLLLLLTYDQSYGRLTVPQLLQDCWQVMLLLRWAAGTMYVSPTAV